MQADISIHGRGFYALFGVSDQGKEWLTSNVDDEGIPYTDSMQYAVDIAEGATVDGLVVDVNGFEYLAGGRRGEAITT
jgi:hypothetical protein